MEGGFPRACVGPLSIEMHPRIISMFTTNQNVVYNLFMMMSMHGVMSIFRETNTPPTRTAS